VPLQEQHHERLEEIPVRLLAEPVSLVGRDQVPHRAAGPAHRGHDLLRLGEGHPGIVRALDDQERAPDAVRLPERRQAPEEGPLDRVALVAVLGTAQVLPVG
jgi:hypothetical protein